MSYLNDWDIEHGADVSLMRVMLEAAGAISGRGLPLEAR
jgi:hypothetical protein